MPNPTNTSTAVTKTADTEVVKDPDWTHALALFDSLKFACQLTVALQVQLGQEMFHLKKESGFIGKGTHKKKGQEPHGAVLKTWPQLVESKLGKPDKGGVSVDTIDRWIQMWRAAQHRLEKIGGQQKLIDLIESDPAKLTESERGKLNKFTERIVNGDSQKSLLRELRIAKLPTQIGGDTSKKDTDLEDDPVEPSLSQQAFAFFEPFATSLINLRTNRDYQTLIHNLPDTSGDPAAITLTTLESELKAQLADIAKARAAQSN